MINGIDFATAFLNFLTASLELGQRLMRFVLGRKTTDENAPHDDKDVIDADNAPGWWHSIESLKKSKNWKEVYFQGAEHLAEAKSRPEPAMDIFLVWMAIAEWHGPSPNYQAALSLTNLVLGRSTHAGVRAEAYNTRAIIQFRRDCMEEANQDFLQTLSIQPAHLAGLYNRVAYGCAVKSKPLLRICCQALLEHYPEAGSPSSELGKNILRDEDFVFLRCSALFLEYFPRLAAVRRPDLVEDSIARLRAASIACNAQKCRKYSRLLRRCHPAIDDPGTKEGSYIMWHKDFGFLRELRDFAELFPSIAFRLRGIPPSVIGAILAAIYVLIPALARALMSSG